MEDADRYDPWDGRRTPEGAREAARASDALLLRLAAFGCLVPAGVVLLVLTLALLYALWRLVL